VSADDRPLTTLEAVYRIKAHCWALISGLASEIAERCELRELDRMTDAEEVRNAVLSALKEETE
jgi:hypothetical protein